MKLSSKVNFFEKNILPVIVFILLPEIFWGQKVNEEKFDLLKTRPFIVSFDINKRDRIPVSEFNKIVFIDNRADTSMMGYVEVDRKEGLRKISFPERASSYLDIKLNKFLLSGRDTSKKTLVIVLNDLWFNETVTQAGWLEGTLLGNEKLISTCFFNVECFIRDGQTIKKTGTLDTAFIKKGWLPNNCNVLLEKAFAQAIFFAQQNSSIDKSAINTEKEFDSLIAFNSSFPILKTVRPERGIYFSFNDFLNNTPLAIPFEIKELSRSYKVGYKLPDGVNRDKAWGVCDGEYIYMHLDSNYYKMERKNNFFETLAPETIEIINTFSQKAVHSAMWYFVYENPFKLFALEPFLKPGTEKHFRYKRYFLNILDGSLR